MMILQVGAAGNAMNTIASAMQGLSTATNEAQQANINGDEFGVAEASRKKAVATQAINIAKADMERDLKITDSLAKVANAVQPS